MATFARMTVYPYGVPKVIECKSPKALQDAIRMWLEMHSPGAHIDIEISIVMPHKRYSDGSSTCGKCDICNGN